MSAPLPGPVSSFLVEDGEEPIVPALSTGSAVVIPFARATTEDNYPVVVRRIDLSDASIRLFATRSLLGQKVRVVFPLQGARVFDGVFRVLWMYPAEKGLVENGGGVPVDGGGNGCESVGADHGTGAGPPAQERAPGDAQAAEQQTLLGRFPAYEGRRAEIRGGGQQQRTFWRRWLRVCNSRGQRLT